jgi:archaellum component FlaG (FlaF/FlaG flagellin family)
MRSAKDMVLFTSTIVTATSVAAALATSTTTTATTRVHIAMGCVSTAVKKESELAPFFCLPTV